MNDLLTMLDQMRRPKLLIQAARIGAAEYRRDLHLTRHFGMGTLPRPGEALLQLMEVEAELDGQRRTANATYSVGDHVEVMIAMMGEARELRNAHPQE